MEYFLQTDKKYTDLPNKATVLAHRGAAKAGVNRLCEAREDLKEAIRLKDDQYPWAQSQLGNVYRLLGTARMNQDDFEKAYDQFDAVYKQVKKTESENFTDAETKLLAWTHATHGASLIRSAEVHTLNNIKLSEDDFIDDETKKVLRKIYREAAKELIESLNLYPEQSWAYGYLGSAQLFLGDLSQVNGSNDEQILNYLIQSVNNMGMYFKLDVYAQRWVGEIPITYAIRQQQCYSKKDEECSNFNSNIVDAFYQKNPRNIGHILMMAFQKQYLANETGSPHDIQEALNVWKQLIFAYNHQDRYMFKIVNPSFEDGFVDFYQMGDILIIIFLIILWKHWSTLEQLDTIPNDLKKILENKSQIVNTLQDLLDKLINQVRECSEKISECTDYDGESPCDETGRAGEDCEGNQFSECINKYQLLFYGLYSFVIVPNWYGYLGKK